MSQQQYFVSFILFLLTLDSLNVTMVLQYLPTYLKLKRPICDRFAMLFSIAIIWFYAAILTWSGAYKNENEANCRVDSSGLIAGSPWWDFSSCAHHQVAIPISLSCLSGVSVLCCNLRYFMQDRPAISIPMGSSNFQIWRCFYYDDRFFCCFCGGLFSEPLIICLLLIYKLLHSLHS